jgi:hypothetical protein
MTNEPRRDRNSTIYLAIESDMHDLVSMAHAACLLLELYDGERRAAGQRNDCSGAELVKFTDQWFSAADFSVHHLSEMAHALKAKYEGQGA